MSLKKVAVIGIVAAAAAEIYKLLNTKDSSMEETTDAIKQELCAELLEITHKNPEAVRNFIANLGNVNGFARDFPEIERIELAFRRTGSSNTIERLISTVYRSGEEIKLRTSTGKIDCDAMPGEIMEQIVRSKTHMAVYQLYSKRGESTI